MSKGIKFYISKGLRKFLNPPAIRDSQLDKTVAVWDHCTISNTSIGRYTYVSDHTLIVHADIGAFCSISSYCQIGGAAHPIDFVSSSPLFYSGHNAFKTNFSKNEFKEYKKTIIGNDVWIGTHALIKSGVKIADGAIIGMGAVVTHDIGPYEIWVGNPAKMIKKRFDDKAIRELSQLGWWSWSEQKIREHADLFKYVENFLKVGKGDTL